MNTSSATRRRRAAGQVAVLAVLVILAVIAHEHDFLRSALIGGTVVPLGELIKLWRDGRRHRSQRP